MYSMNSDLGSDCQTDEIVAREYLVPEPIGFTLEWIAGALAADDQLASSASGADFDEDLQRVHSALVRCNFQAAEQALEEAIEHFALIQAQVFTIARQRRT